MNSKEEVSYIKVGSKKYVNVINKRSIETLIIEDNTIGFRFIAEPVSMAYMKKLETVILPKDLECLDTNFGFYNCSKLSKVIVAGDDVNVKFHLPESIVRIIGPGFSGTSIEEVNIGKNISVLSVDSIRNTKKLRAINVDDDNNYYSSIDGVLFNKEKTILLYYPADKFGKEYHVPTSVQLRKMLFRTAKN